MWKTYYAQWKGETVEVTADFADPECEVLASDIGETGFTVADFKRSPALAMLWRLRHAVILEKGNPAETRTGEAIEASLLAMKMDAD